MTNYAEQIKADKVFVKVEQYNSIAPVLKAFKDRGVDIAIRDGVSIDDRYYGFYNDNFDYLNNIESVCIIGGIILTLESFEKRYPLTPQPEKLTTMNLTFETKTKIERDFPKPMICKETGLIVMFEGYGRGIVIKKCEYSTREMFYISDKWDMDSFSDIEDTNKINLTIKL